MTSQGAPIAANYSLLEMYTSFVHDTYSYMVYFRAELYQYNIENTRVFSACISRLCVGRVVASSADFRQYVTQSLTPGGSGKAFGFVCLLQSISIRLLWIFGVNVP